jgi:hypothetical protein
LITIIDITRAHAGSETPIVARFLQAHPPDDSELTIIGFPRQKEPVVPLTATYNTHFVEVPDSSAPAAVTGSVTSALVPLVQRGGPVLVASFWNDVLAAADVMRNKYPEITSEHLRRYAGGAKHDSRVPLWDASFMSETEAVESLLHALIDRAGGTARKTVIRRHLEALDARFQKDAGGFASQNGFITALIDLAQRRGLVEVHGSDPDALISVTDRGRDAASNSAVPQDSLQRGVSRVQRRDTDTIGPTPPPSGSAARSRSARFVDVLRAADFGPFMTHRTAVYEEIAGAVAQGPTPLKTLVGNAVRVVREGSSEATDKFPWSRLRIFVERLMAQNPVAMSGDEKIALSWANGDREVDGLAPDWECRLDGEIVLFLVDQGMEITLHDLPDLAGALYSSRHEAFVQRAYDVVALLVREGVLTESNPGQPLLRSEPSSGDDVVPFPQRSR